MPGYSASISRVNYHVCIFAASSLERGVGFDDPNISPSERSGKIKERLRFFFLKRPGLDALTEKGIIKCKFNFCLWLDNIF